MLPPHPETLLDKHADANPADGSEAEVAEVDDTLRLGQLCLARRHCERSCQFPHDDGSIETRIYARVGAAAVAYARSADAHSRTGLCGAEPPNAPRVSAPVGSASAIARRYEYKKLVECAVRVAVVVEQTVRPTKRLDRSGDDGKWGRTCERSLAGAAARRTAANGVGHLAANISVHVRGCSEEGEMSNNPSMTRFVLTRATISSILGGTCSRFPVTEARRVASTVFPVGEQTLFSSKKSLPSRNEHHHWAQVHRPH